MKIKTCAAICLIPFLAANTNNQSLVLKRFLASTEAGTAYVPEDFVQIPANNLAKFLTSLKGCKKTEVEPLSNGGVGLQWKCADKPKLRAAVLYFDADRISRILPSTVDRQTVSSLGPIDAVEAPKPLTVLDEFANAVRKGLDTGALGITPALTEQQRVDLLSVQSCKINLGASSTRLKPILYWVCGVGDAGKAATLALEGDKIVSITVEPIAAKPTNVRR